MNNVPASTTTSSPHLFTTEPSRWLAVRTRNPLAHSAFLYSVKTTHITCRPTCAARLARRSNVSFHNNYAVAQAAGFRACKRCRPDVVGFAPQRQRVARACRAIADAEADADGVEADGKGMVGLKELAAQAGVTRSHFHRLFKSVMGVSPRSYAVGVRVDRLLGLETPVVEGEASTVGRDGVQHIRNGTIEKGNT